MYIQIRVENTIRRLKDYTGTLCNTKLIDDMVFVTCAVCNLKNRLIKWLIKFNYTCYIL